MRRRFPRPPTAAWLTRWPGPECACPERGEAGAGGCWSGDGGRTDVAFGGSLRQSGRLDRSGGGAEGIRTPDLLIANETRYQLRHSPESLFNQRRAVGTEGKP